MSVIHVQAPDEVPYYVGRPTVFLGGSIEMGKARDWQLELVEKFADRRVIMINPRRDDWASVVGPSTMDEQVNWELEHLLRADINVFYFDPGTTSPITLLELGLVLATPWKHDIAICCPDGYFRLENVQITAKWYDEKVCDDFDSLVARLDELITAWER